MRQYIWYHPLYVLEAPGHTTHGQRDNAIKNKYVVLQENELHQVNATDHLTIVGHSTPPKVTLDEEDTGLYIQGETAGQIVDRLMRSGLRFAPKVLTLECCKAGVIGGIAQKISTHPFFKNCVIEANASSIGRNPGTIHWGGMTEDIYGRVVLHAAKSPWLFLLRGQSVASHLHGTYTIQDVIETIVPFNFHKLFFTYYHAGICGGRVGRYCFFTKNEISLEQALIFANEEPESATSKALDCLWEKSLLTSEIVSNTDPAP